METTDKTNTQNESKISLHTYMTALYLFLMPLGLIPVLGGISLLKILTYPIAIVCVICYFNDKTELNFNLTQLLFAVFIMYTALSVLYYDTYESEQSVCGFVQIMFVSFVFCCRKCNKYEYKVIEKSFVLMGIAVLVLFFLSGKTLLEGRNTLTILGTPADPNELCGYLILPEIFCFKYIFSQKSNLKSKIFYAVYLLFIVFAALKTGSRGGLLAIMFTAVLYSVTGVKETKRKAAALAAVIIIAVIAAKLVIPNLPGKIAERMAIERIIEDRATGRLDIWKILIDDTLKSNKSYLIGGGTTSAIDALKGADIGNTVAHNQFIQVFHDGGLIGTVLFVSAYASAILQNLKRNIYASIAAAGFAVLGMTLTFDPSMKIFWNTFMFCMMRFESDDNFFPSKQHLN